MHSEGHIEIKEPENREENSKFVPFMKNCIDGWFIAVIAHNKRLSLGPQAIRSQLQEQ